MALAYAVLFLPKAIGSSRAAIAAVPPGLEQVARSQGRSAGAAFRSVTGRIAAPGIAAGGLLVMVTAMKELPATLMLRPTGFDTLATETVDPHRRRERMALRPRTRWPWSWWPRCRRSSWPAASCPGPRCLEER